MDEEEETQEQVMDDIEEETAIEENEDKGTSDDEEESGCGLLDTAIQIQSKGEIKLEYQRSASNMSSVSEISKFEQDNEQEEVWMDSNNNDRIIIIQLLHRLILYHELVIDICQRGKEGGCVHSMFY